MNERILNGGKFLIALALIVGMTAMTAQAVDRLSAQDGDWDLDATWDTVVPLAADNAYLEGGYTVTIDTGMTAVATSLRGMLPEK